MKRIRKLPTRLNKNGTPESWAIFWCDPCLQEVEKPLSDGKKCKSCGCTKIKHGEISTKLYRVWANMKQRVLNPNHKSYKDYGDRGITICPEWLEFIPFRDWALSNGYAEGLQINRIKNEFRYEPSNCNFVPAEENSRNRRNQRVKNIEIANEIRDLHKTGNYTQKELAKRFNVSHVLISYIINNKIWGET